MSSLKRSALTFRPLEGYAGQY